MMANALSGDVKAGGEVLGEWVGDGNAGKKRDRVSDGFPMGCLLTSPT